MKITILITTLLLGLLPTGAVADGTPDNKSGQGANTQKAANKALRVAARQYKGKSDWFQNKAKQTADPTLKKHYTALSKAYAELSGHKRAALKAQKKGKSYDWTAYNQLREKTDALEKELATTGPESKQKPGGKKTKPTVTQDEKNIPEKAVGKPDNKTFKTKSGFTIRTKL